MAWPPGARYYAMAWARSRRSGLSRPDHRDQAIFGRDLMATTRTEKDTMGPIQVPANRYWGAVAGIFAAFLRLGLTSFGGPIAHLGYFRVEFVERRRWLSEAGYAELVALCQLLPGPAS